MELNFEEKETDDQQHAEWAYPFSTGWKEYIFHFALLLKV